MTKAAKVAVSIPAAAFDALERQRRKEHLSRSAAVTQALLDWLRTRDTNDADRSYAEAYLRQPDHTRELGAMATAAVSSWEPWE